MTSSNWDGRNKKMIVTVIWKRFLSTFKPQKRQLHKIVKHTKTIGQQFADELFECV